jgi:anti-anti-sigma regulatory factor
MAKRSTESKLSLSGDWTIAGVVMQCQTLSRFLQELESGRKKEFHIDCGNIDSIDMSGLQLLHVWVELVRMRGVEARLLNVPDGMQQIICRLGLGQTFTDNSLMSPDATLS